MWVEEVDKQGCELLAFQKGWERGKDKGGRFEGDVKKSDGVIDDDHEWVYGL